MVRIVTDSAADFEPWELEQKNIKAVPLSVIFGEKEYKENIDLTKEEFYELRPRIILTLLMKQKKTATILS